jgi:hypothetical protein
MSFQVVNKVTIAQDLFNNLDKFVADHGDSGGEAA